MHHGWQVLHRKQSRIDRILDDPVATARQDLQAQIASISFPANADTVKTLSESFLCTMRAEMELALDKFTKDDPRQSNKDEQKGDDE
jgi:hypothetical protein